MIYFLSHSFTIIIDIANRTWNIVAVYFSKGLQLLFPPFEALNIKDVIWSFTNFHANYFIFNTAYSLVYLTIILFFTVQIFNKKKFEN